MREVSGETWNGWKFVDPYKNFKDSTSLKKWVIEDLCSSSLIIADTETIGTDYTQGPTILGINLGNIDTKECTYIPTTLSTKYKGFFSIEEAVDLFDQATKNKIIGGQFFSFDYKQFLAAGLDLYDRKFIDTAMLAYIENENRYSFKLENLCNQEFGPDYDADEIEVWLLKHIGSKEFMVNSEWAPIFYYSCGDIANTGNYLLSLVNKLKQKNLLKGALDLSKYSIALANMEFHGMLIDTKRLDWLSDELDRERKKIYNPDNLEESFLDFNPGSPKVIGEKFPFLPNTKAATIEDLKYDFPAHTEKLEKISEYRKLNTLYSTFCENIKLFLKPQGTLHTQFHIVRVVTPRLSTTEPNLMNLPRRKDNYSIKKLFLARPGCLFGSIDYSQIELRLIAHYSQEKSLLTAYINGEDVHNRTAIELGIPRDIAKNVNFSLPFGISAKSFAIMYLKGDFIKGQEYRNSYRAKYPNIKNLYSKCQKTAEAYKRIKYWTGNYRNFNGVEYNSHKAMPNLIQGGAGEIFRIAIVNSMDCIKGNTIQLAVKNGWEKPTLLKESEVKLLMQVHDELLYELKIDKWFYELQQIIAIMTDFTFTVPIEVELKLGFSWGTVVKLKDFFFNNTLFSAGFKLFYYSLILAYHQVIENEE